MATAVTASTWVKVVDSKNTGYVYSSSLTWSSIIAMTVLAITIQKKYQRPVYFVIVPTL